ncbi:hypothetical protein [Brucella sp. IR073]|uniref:hypothetical protein n=1 Tax=unclassified Brucella TaxID=2632610 RepID=UPI003B981011
MPELVTKSDLQAAMTTLQGEFRNDLQVATSTLRSELQVMASDLRSEFRNDLQGTRSELRAAIDGLALKMTLLVGGAITAAVGIILAAIPVIIK